MSLHFLVESSRHISGSYHCRALFLFYATLRIFIRSAGSARTPVQEGDSLDPGVAGVNSEPVGSQLSLQYLDLECFIFTECNRRFSPSTSYGKPTSLNFSIQALFARSSFRLLIYSSFGSVSRAVVS